MALNIDERTAKMKSMRFNDLMTLQEIGDEFGITRERVRQLIGNTGLKALKERKRKRNNKIRESIDKTNAELADEFNIRKEYIGSIRSDVYHKVEGGARRKGQKVEQFIKKELDDRNIKNEMMPLNHKFDILVFDNIKVDVKGAFDHFSTSPNIKSNQWHFNLGADERGRYCDFFICVIWKSKDCFIIPYDVIDNEKSNMNNLFFCWPTKRPEIGKYQKYHNRWDLLLKDTL